MDDPTFATVCADHLRALFLYSFGRSISHISICMAFSEIEFEDGYGVHGGVARGPQAHGPGDDSASIRENGRAYRARRNASGNCGKPPVQAFSGIVLLLNALRRCLRKHTSTPDWV